MEKVKLLHPSRSQTEESEGLSGRGGGGAISGCGGEMMQMTSHSDRDGMKEEGSRRGRDGGEGAWRTVDPGSIDGVYLPGEVRRRCWRAGSDWSDAERVTQVTNHSRSDGDQTLKLREWHLVTPPRSTRGRCGGAP